MTAYNFSQLIDFTRTSSGTFTDSTGKIASTPASGNLFLFTQEFDNVYWNKTNAIVSANSITAPDGTATADKLVGTAATGYHAVSRAITGTAAPYVYSVYLKAAEYTRAILCNSSSGAWAATFDLSSGTVLSTTGGSVLSAAILPVGNGWYRCSVRYTGTASAYDHTVFGYPVGATLNNFGAQYTGDGISGVFVWGIQVEQASAVTTYTRNFGGVFPPRFDYDPVTLAPKGLLIEEQRTNLVTYSEQLDNASWTKLSTTVTANAAVAPDGVTTADTVTPTTASAYHAINQRSTVVNGVPYAASFYVKANGYNKVAIREGDYSGAIASFDLSNGTVLGAAGGTGYITPLSNGWFRVALVSVSAGTSMRHDLVVLSPSYAFNDAVDFAGNGTSGVFIWGAQLEAGAFATSYIPTVASQVTRTADQAVIAAPNFASWYNQSAGTVVADYATLIPVAAVVTATPAPFSLNDGTANNRIDAFLASSAPGITRGNITASGAGQAAMDAAPALLSGKIALAYSANDFAFSAGGGAALTDTSGSVPTTTQLQLGRLLGGAALNGHIRSIKYFPTRLSNTQLQALTA